MFKKVGPGMLIAAAFIGPGTVTTCIGAGIDFKFGLLWGLLLSVLATLVLQEMAGRLGLSTREGIPGLIRHTVEKPFPRVLLIGVILSAIVIGNMAYEAGNISGAVLGLEALAGTKAAAYYPFLTGFLSFLLLWFGSSRVLEKTFAALVVLMSLSFLLTAVITRPDPLELLKGLFLPGLQQGGLLTVVALIGTTVVPYNLFLYTSLVSEKWGTAKAVGFMRRDILYSVLVGGLVSMAIVVTAAGSPAQSLEGVLDLARGLEPLYGQFALYGIGIGLFAAGITSAITAPLAAAFVAGQCFGWGHSRKDVRFRLVWILVLGMGVAALSLDFQPLEVIFFAQVANGILLPVIAVFLWWAVNQPRLMQGYENTLWQNALTALVLILVTGLGIWSIFRILGP